MWKVPVNMKDNETPGLYTNMKTFKNDLHNRAY